ncbi:MAG TPA: MarR family transcriptional regulator [Chitinispirillaceae bacterium]|nr:MarR family transcriptional regulator [Chitinispirillaceae bacterium]
MDNTLSSKVFLLFNKLIFLEKKSIFKFDNITLYPSEIHLMQLIAEGYSVNATLMAEKLGITKGAVSQTISRLQRKKILIKTKNSNNKNELTASFTQLGRDLLEQFNNKRSNSSIKFHEYLNSINENDEIVIKEFLAQCNSFLSDLI